LQTHKNSLRTRLSSLLLAPILLNPGNGSVNGQMVGQLACGIIGSQQRPCTGAHCMWL